MSKTIKILLALLLILIGVVAFLWGRKDSQPVVSVELSKQMYKKGERIGITVYNNSFHQVCFSSCYPYYLQWKDEDWHSYNYPSCPREDLNVPCIAPGEEKKFRLTLDKKIKARIHRIAIPIDKKGESGENFEEDQEVYSEPFDVK